MAGGLRSGHEASWVNPASTRRFTYRVWRPASARALVVVVHGFGEHGGRYTAVADALAARGVCVAVPDLWGHGRSEGRRGDVVRFADYLDDLRALTEAVFLPLAGESTYVVYGHSFGGLVAIHWALAAPPGLRRLVAQSPFLDVGFPVPRWKRLAARWLRRCWPAARLPIALDVSKLSHDPSVVEAYRRDPLVHRVMSARAYATLTRAQGDALQRAGEVRMPVLLLCGAEDRIVSLAAAQRWYDQLTCEKQEVVFPGCYHELHFEAVREDVVRLVAEWAMSS